MESPTGLEFGCVPAWVCEGLQDIGNWKARAAAVEALHTAVLGVQDKLVLLPTLSKFLQFLLALVADPNFKISISVMRIVRELLSKLGSDVQPYLGMVMETLINKMGDRNELVRQADVAVMASLMQLLGPQPVLNALGGAFVHPDWRVREIGRNVVLQALLSHAKNKFDYPSVVRTFSEGVLDESERVQKASLEGLATLHERLGALLQGLLTAVGAPDTVKRQVAERVRLQLPLPYLNVDGMVEHQPHARPASAGKPKPPLAPAPTSAPSPAASPAVESAAVPSPAAVSTLGAASSPAAVSTLAAAPSPATVSAVTVAPWPAAVPSPAAATSLAGVSLSLPAAIAPAVAEMPADSTAAALDPTATLVRPAPAAHSPSFSQSPNVLGLQTSTASQPAGLALEVQQMQQGTLAAGDARASPPSHTSPAASLSVGLDPSALTPAASPFDYGTAAPPAAAAAAAAAAAFQASPAAMELDTGPRPAPERYPSWSSSMPSSPGAMSTGAISPGAISPGAGSVQAVDSGGYMGTVAVADIAPVEQSSESLLRWVRPTKASSSVSSKAKHSSRAQSLSVAARPASQLAGGEAEAILMRSGSATGRSPLAVAAPAARMTLSPAPPSPTAYAAASYASLAASRANLGSPTTSRHGAVPPAGGNSTGTYAGLAAARAGLGSQVAAAGNHSAEAQAKLGAGLASLSPASSGKSHMADASQPSMQQLNSGHMPIPIQHRRQAMVSSLSGSEPKRLSAHGETTPEPPSPPAAPGGQEPEVEDRSESLLLWRLPERPAANARRPTGASPGSVQAQEASPAAKQNKGQHAVQRSASSRSSPKDGGSSYATKMAAQPARRNAAGGILQKLDGFKKKLFGPDTPAVPQQQELPSVPWSIPAMHAEASRETSRSESRIEEPSSREDTSSQQGDTSSQQGDTPTKGTAKLSTLKQRRQQEAAERRRVWSAPLAPSQRPSLLDPEDLVAIEQAREQAQQGPLSHRSTHEGDTGASPAASPARPGLQALKVRARTARLSQGSAAQGPSSPGGQYGMDVLNDVFGPDRAAIATAWSPQRQGPGRLTMPARASSPSWFPAPNSPSSASSIDLERLSTGFMQKLGGGGNVSSPAAADPGTPAFSPMAADMSPLEDPEGTMQQLLQALKQANMSQRKELDWQAQYKALSNARRIIHNHASTLLPCLHQFVLAAAPVIDSLRSIPARLAITVFTEMIEVLGPALDSELEHLVPILVKKAGLVSVAGRDNFLAVEADRALSSLVATGSEGKVVTSLLGCLSNTKAADIKGKIAMHLDACVQRHGHRLVTNPSLISKLLRSAVLLLDEGALEARTSGKRILWEVRRLMDVSLGPEEFRKALGKLEMKTDKVWDIFESGRPPPPIRTQPIASCSPGAGGSPCTPSFQPLSPGAGSRAASLLMTGSGAGGYAALNEANLALGGSHNTYQLYSGTATPISPAGPKPSLRPTVSFHTLTLGGERGSVSGSPSGTPTKAAAGSSLRPSLRPASGRGAAAASLDPALQAQLDKVQHDLGSKEWRERVQGLLSLRELAGELTSLPGDLLLRLTDDLALRLTDANLKVQLEALPTLRAVLEAGAGGAGEGLSAPLNSLVPALAKALDSTSSAARQLAAEALDSMVSRVDAALFIQPLMHSLGASTNVRSRGQVLERLPGLLPPLCASRPALVQRHVLPPLLTALGDKRQEVRGPVQAALGVLAGCMGLELLEACMAQAPAHSLMVSELVAQAQQAPEQQAQVQREGPSGQAAEAEAEEFEEKIRNATLS